MRRAERPQSTLQKNRDKEARLRRLRRKLGEAKSFGRQVQVNEIQREIDEIKAEYDFRK